MTTKAHNSCMWTDRMMAETSWDVETMIHVTTETGIDLSMGVVCDGKMRKNLALARLASTLFIVGSNARMSLTRMTRTMYVRRSWRNTLFTVGGTWT